MWQIQDLIDTFKFSLQICKRRKNVYFYTTNQEILSLSLKSGKYVSAPICKLTSD